MEVGRVISRKKEETVEEKTNKKSRKLSSETKASEVEEFDELRQSGVTLRSSQAQEAIYEEQDIGCFLNIGLVESPVLEFEDLQFTFWVFLKRNGSKKCQSLLFLTLFTIKSLI